jgi:hypothetical protein
VYFSIAGVFAGWCHGYMATDPDPRTGWKVWAIELSIAVLVGALWPLSVIAGKVLIRLEKRRRAAIIERASETLATAREIAREYCEKDSQIDSGNLYYALSASLEIIAELEKSK